MVIGHLGYLNHVLPAVALAGERSGEDVTVLNQNLEERTAKEVKILRWKNA